jgi:SAM-dependent methyltransferase
MANPFASDEMASGYATARPPVHPRILEQAIAELARPQPFQRALDLGCGAGLSTRALAPFADQCIGIEPAEPMLKWTSTIAPAADFVVGRAEAIPIRGRSVEIITAAGSLNYADLGLALAEAARVLTPDGVLLVYDFSPGMRFTDSESLHDWFSRFTARFPFPRGEGRELNPGILAQFDSGLRMQAHRNFEIAIELSPEFYLDYMLTETNVAAAVRAGVPLAEIRSWCAETLTPVWERRRHEVLFRGYFACLLAT